MLCLEHGHAVHIGPPDAVKDFPRTRGPRSQPFRKVPPFRLVSLRSCLNPPLSWPGKRINCAAATAIVSGGPASSTCWAWERKRGGGCGGVPLQSVEAAHRTAEPRVSCWLWGLALKRSNFFKKSVSGSQDG